LAFTGGVEEIVLASLTDVSSVLADDSLVESLEYCAKAVE
jgi:hypothetical protein